MLNDHDAGLLILQAFVEDLQQMARGSVTVDDLVRVTGLHYRTQNMFASCGAFEQLANGSAWWDGRDEQALRDQNIILEAAREQPQAKPK